MSSSTIIYELSKYKGVYFNKTSNKWNVKSYTSDYYLIETQKLKEILSNIENKKIVCTHDKLTFGYLVRKEVIFTQCKKI